MPLPVPLLFNRTPLASPLLWNRSCSVLKLSVHQKRRRWSNVSVGRLFTTSTGTLKPDSITPKDTTAPLGAIKRCKHKIRTLDPSKLTEGDYIDFSLKSQPVLGAILQPRWPADLLIPRSPRKPVFTGNLWSSNRFPPGAHGFMYYHVSSSNSPLAGELRFRVTSSRDPASFAAGADLLTERSLPWRYPLYKIVCRPYWRDIVALLLQDGLVSQHTLDLVTAAVGPLHTGSPNGRGHEGTPALSDARHPSRLSSTPVLSAFGEEFSFRYAADLNFCGVFASPDAILTHYMRHITAFRLPVLQGKYVHFSPFEGSVVCCFERSTLPEHAGRRVVVIRIKRFIDSDPIRQVPFPRPGLGDGPGRAHLVEKLRPREGELLKAVKRARSGQVQPWGADVDKLWSGNGNPVGIAPWKALRVLFENEELYGSPPQSDV